MDAWEDAAADADSPASPNNGVAAWEDPGRDETLSGNQSESGVTEDAGTVPIELAQNPRKRLRRTALLREALADAGVPPFDVRGNLGKARQCIVRRQTSQVSLHSQSCPDDDGASL